MILYTNGASHTAAAKAANNYIFARDDKSFWAQAKRPHPNNLNVSWSAHLASLLKMSLLIDAEGDRTNESIIESTKVWIEKTQETIFAKDVLMIIEFTTDNFEMIKDFHLFLKEKGYTHIFFNDTGSFNEDYDFGSSYIDPYLPESSYVKFLEISGHETIITSNTYFDGKAHAAWGRNLAKYLIKEKIV